MKIAAIVVGLFLATVATAEESCPLALVLQKHIQTCVELKQPSEETLQLMEADKVETSVDAKCFFACMMKEAGFMHNAKLNFDNVEGALKSAKNQEMAGTVLEAIKSCKDESEVSDDECEVAGNYAKCMRAKKAMLMH